MQSWDYKFCGGTRSTSVVEQVIEEFSAKSDHLMKLSKGVKVIKILLDSFSIHCILKTETVRADWPVNFAMDENETKGLEVFYYLREGLHWPQESIQRESTRCEGMAHIL